MLDQSETNLKVNESGERLIEFYNDIDLDDREYMFKEENDS